MLKEKIKELVSKNVEGNNKKKIENLVIFVIILIITIIAINVIWNGEKKEEKQTADPNKKLAVLENDTQESKNEEHVSEDTLAKNLENILEQIQGVGKVKVLITYSQTSETIPMYNQDTSQKDTEESDKSRWYTKDN